MKTLLASALLLSIAFACQAGWDYPPTKTVDASDTYFGKTYQDPYRWLENLKDKETEAWFKAQAELTDRLLAKIPAREALVEEWMSLDKLKPATYGDIAYENGRFFYKKTLGGENVGKLYFREGWDGAGKLLFDPGTYKAGVVTTIESIVPSWDGKYVLMGFSSGGAEYSELRVLDVATDTLLPDKMYPSMGPTGWAPDSKSFFYDMGKVTDIKSPDIELDRKTMWHKLGASVASDTDIFSDESHPELDISAKEMPSAGIPESYPEYLVGSVGTVQNEMRIFYAPASELKNGKIKWDVLCKPSDNLVRGIEFHDQHIYAVTHTDAPKYKVVRTSVTHPDWAHAETVVPEAADSIEGIVKCPRYLLIVYSNGVTGRLAKYEFASGKISEVKLPLSGMLSVECPDWKSDRCLVSITSWTVPKKTFDYDAEKDTFTTSAFDSSVTYPGFENLVSEEVEAPSYDGTMVPLSIIHRKDIPLNGSSCCILEGYGAYGNSYTPYFSPKISAFEVMRSELHWRGIFFAALHRV